MNLRFLPIKATLMLSAAITLVVIATPAFAATITVNVSGAPQTGKCNLTDAIQAASTNHTVHGCVAGGTGTDTIQLAANTTYQNYGAVLHFPTSGGAVVLQGVLSGGQPNTVIMAPNYGYPSPNPLNPDVCLDPAAMFTGGTVTIKNLTLQSSVDGTVGICQYAGSLTINTAVIGDENFTFGFNRGGIQSWANTVGLHRTLSLSNVDVVHNYSFQDGGGVLAIGNVTVTITGGNVKDNTTESSGGAIAWIGDGSGKMGNMTISGATIFENTSFSWGGGIYLDGDNPNATVTVSGTLIEQNDASFTGGGILVGANIGSQKLVISNGTFFLGNRSDEDDQQASLNSDANTYNAVWCVSSSTISTVHGSEWTHVPPLNGDGTCSFP